MLIVFYDGCEFHFYPQIGKALGSLCFIPKFQFGGLEMFFYLYNLNIFIWFIQY